MADGEGSPNASAEEAPLPSCAVCLEPFSVPSTSAPSSGAGSYDGPSAPVRMPCCWREGSTMQLCRRCVQIICQRGISNYVGRCPFCQALYTMPSGHGGQPVLLSETTPLQCRMCQQVRVIADPRRVLCELCALGSRYAFAYECERCHRHQRIPHPMWRYQAGPREFGNTTWACHVGCGDFTHWRLLPEHAALVPPELCPESWGRRSEWLAAVREQRLAELAREEEPNGPEPAAAASNTCIIA